MSARLLILFAALIALSLGITPVQRDGSCILIQELAAAAPILERGACSTPLSPASTFKIPHALVALETGVVTAATVERWDGVRHEAQREWNRDHR